MPLKRFFLGFFQQLTHGLLGYEKRWTMYYYRRNYNEWSRSSKLLEGVVAFKSLIEKLALERVCVSVRARNVIKVIVATFCRELTREHPKGSKSACRILLPNSYAHEQSNMLRLNSKKKSDGTIFHWYLPCFPGGVTMTRFQSPLLSLE